MRKNEKFTLIKFFFRQINSLVKPPLLSRNFCQKCVRVNFRNFHSKVKSTKIDFTIFLLKCRQINFFSSVKIHEQQFPEIIIILFPHYSLLMAVNIPTSIISHKNSKNMLMYTLLNNFVLLENEDV